MRKSNVKETIPTLRTVNPFVAHFSLESNGDKCRDSFSWTGRQVLVHFAEDMVIFGLTRGSTRGPIRCVDEETLVSY